MPRESSLSLDRQKNEAAKRVIGWRDEIKRLRELHLATLKELKQEDHGLEKRLHEIITGEQLDLFPGADVAQPKCLSDSTILWTLLREKDLELRIFRIDVPGEKDPRFYMDAQFHADAPLRAGIHTRLIKAVGTEKGRAILNTVGHCLDGIIPDPANKRAGKLRRQLLTVKKDAPPEVPDIDFTKTLPTVAIHACYEMDGGIKGQGNKFEPDISPASLENPSSVKPEVFGYAGKLYVAVNLWGGEGNSFISDTAAVEVVPEADWEFGTVSSADKAFDQRRMGYLFKASDGHSYVCKDWSTAMRLVSFRLTPPDAFTSHDGKKMAADDYNFFADFLEVERAIEKGEALKPELILGSDNGRQLITSRPTGTYGYPEGSMVLLNLYAPDDFDKAFPTLKPTKQQEYQAEDSIPWIAALAGQHVLVKADDDTELDLVIGPIEDGELVDMRKTDKPAKKKKAKK